MGQDMTKDELRVSDRLAALGYTTEVSLGVLVARIPNDEGFVTIDVEKRKAAFGWQSHVLVRSFVKDKIAGRGWQERLADAVHAGVIAMLAKEAKP